MEPEQEKKLVERAKYSAEAFGELYDLYHDQIFGYALRRSADIDLAEDITSAVFFKAFKKIKKFRWQGVPFSHWLYRIANREILNHHSKQQREISYETETNERSTALEKELADGKDELKKYDDYLDLQNYISKLSPNYQEVITLKYFQDMEIAEIAAILRKPEGTIKSWIHRGIGQLRKMMEP